MVDKLVVKNAVNVCVSILLFTCYVYLFGIKSVRKYLDKEIIITEQEDEDKFRLLKEPPPGISDTYFRICYKSILQQS